MLLEGKHGLILGIANKRSIAWGIAQAVPARARGSPSPTRASGSRRTWTSCPQDLKDPLLLPCDVAEDEDIDALAASLGEDFGGLDFVVHSVAFALREELDGQFLNTSREGYRIAQDISAYSLTALARRDGAADGGPRGLDRHPLLPRGRAGGAALQRDGRGEGGAGDVRSLSRRRPGPEGDPRERHFGRARSRPWPPGRPGLSKMLDYYRSTRPCARHRSGRGRRHRLSSWSRRSRGASPAR